MTRVSAVGPRHRRRKRILKRAKGFFGSRHRLFKTANETVMRAEVFSSRDRRDRKGVFRRLWITRLSGALFTAGISYSRFVHGLKNAKIVVNRKLLSDLAIRNPEAFDELVKVAKASLSK
ncbi:MAG: 50S ribosomal protein L20 [Planctomycetota bacterium]